MGSLLDVRIHITDLVGKLKDPTAVMCEPLNAIKRVITLVRSLSIVLRRLETTEFECSIWHPYNARMLFLRMKLPSAICLCRDAVQDWRI